MDALRLVQFTDTHLFGTSGETLRGIATLPTLEAAVRHAAPHIRDACAVLVTGDLVQDDPAGYEPFCEVFGVLGKPVLTLPGNHDDLAAMQLAMGKADFQYCGHRDLAGWRIVMVDSVIAGAAGGRVSNAALANLRKSLADAQYRHALVCLHHHPVPMRSRWLDTVGLENADEFFAILDASPRVRAILWGHVHQAFDGERRGVRLLATPSTCAQFLPHADDFAIDTKPPCYRTLELGTAGDVHTQVHWLESR